MEDGGWNVDEVPDINNDLAENCVPGLVSATFKGSGRGTLDFGSCSEKNTKGYTKVFLNDEWKSTGPPKLKSEVFTFEYKKGDVLKIEGYTDTRIQGGLTKINSFKLEGCEKEGNSVL